MRFVKIRVLASLRAILPANLPQLAQSNFTELLATRNYSKRASLLSFTPTLREIESSTGGPLIDGNEAGKFRRGSRNTVESLGRLCNKFRRGDDYELVWTGRGTEDSWRG